MDYTARVLFVILSLCAAMLFQTYREMSAHLPAPKLDLNKYWGPGDKSSYKEDPTVVVNRIHYPDEVIEDLKQRLGKKLLQHDPLEGTAFEYGFNSKKLKQVVNYWRDNYLPRWREREHFLWSLPQYTTQIQGLQMHFIHTKMNESVKGKKVYPLLLIHGWPGSVREFYDIIPKLSLPSDDKNYVFEVVAPSLPGYGWSQAASKPGLGPAEMAVIFRNLMLRLGYDKFFIQGGDWGSLIGANLAELFPENVLGYHSNMCAVMSPIANIKTLIATTFPSFFLEKGTEEFFPPLSQSFPELLLETGYFHIQATKPDTIGAALTDNPVGLAAYILEKFSTWTNPEFRQLQDGGLEKKFTLDALLDNIMIYYLTNSITTSQRLYAEAFAKSQRDLKMHQVPVTVPTACARFKHDLAHTIDWALKNKFTNLVQVTNYKNGGHFAAMEVPDLLYKDLIDFVNKVLAKN